MKTKHLVLSLLAACVATPTAWAACSINLDVGGNKITNVTMTNLDVPSELATIDYVDSVLQGEAGLMVSPNRLIHASTNKAAHYCAQLESSALNDDTEDMPDIVYSDWRLPSLEELIGLCLRQGSKITYEHNKPLEMAHNGETKELLYSHNNYASDWVTSGICDYSYTYNAQERAENKGLLGEIDSVMGTNTIYDIYDGYDLKLHSIHHPRYTKTMKYPVSVPVNLNTGRVRLGQFAHSEYIEELNQHALCVR